MDLIVGNMYFKKTDCHIHVGEGKIMGRGTYRLVFISRIFKNMLTDVNIWREGRRKVKRTHQILDRKEGGRVDKWDGGIDYRFWLEQLWRLTLV